MRSSSLFSLSLRRLLAPLPALLLLAPAGCARPSGGEAKAATPVEAPPIAAPLVPAREIKVPRVLTLSGQLIGAEQAQVAAGAAGKVLATYIERGSVVKKGALLARLDARILGAQAQESAAQVQSMRAQQAQAQLDCDRTKHMFDKGAISKADFDRAQTQCETSKWSLAAAEAHKVQIAESLRDTEIRAPFSGMVVERGVTAGEYVRADSRVATLVAVDALRVELTVPEADVPAIKEGMEVQFTTAAGDRKTRYRGKIRYVGPSVRQQSRDAIVEAAVDNPARELRPGMFVTAELAIGERPVPAVPPTAVKTEGGQRHVFVAMGGRIEDRLVQAVEARGAGDVPIISGLQPGELVVERITPDVRDGARVK